MLVIIGIIIVIGSVLTGFSMAGGHMHSLVHPSEIVTIGGAALGAMVCSSPLKVIKDLIHGLIATLKGGNVGKVTRKGVRNRCFEFLASPVTTGTSELAFGRRCLFRMRRFLI